MSRLSCNTCQRPLSVCFCSHVRPHHNRWPVHILQDRRESVHALGTARIASLSLSNCNLISIDLEKPNADNHDEIQTLRALQPVLIYPGEHARELTTLSASPECPLVFIDASWRRSRKFLHVFPCLAGLPRYSWQPTTPSRYRIRQQPQANALSTLEAIVHALETLENSPGKLSGMLETMDWVIEQQIRYMGADVYQSNYPNREYK